MRDMQAREAAECMKLRQDGFILVFVLWRNKAVNLINDIFYCFEEVYVQVTLMEFQYKNQFRTGDALLKMCLLEQTENLHVNVKIQSLTCQKNPWGA